MAEHDNQETEDTPGQAPTRTRPKPKPAHRDDPIFDTATAHAIAEDQRRSDRGEPLRRRQQPEGGTTIRILRQAKTKLGLIAGMLTLAGALFAGGYAWVDGQISSAREDERAACELRGADAKASLEREQDRAERCEERLDNCRGSGRRREPERDIEPIDGEPE